MPSVCQNHLSVEGPRIEITRFRKAVRGRQLNDDHRLVKVAFHLGGLVPDPYWGKDPKADEALEAFYGYEHWVLKTPAYVEKGLKTIEAVREDLLKRIPDAKRLADQYFEKVKRFGPRGQQSWCEKNWGTTCEVLVDGQDPMWGGSSVERPSPQRLECYFNTAWCTPYRWMPKVARIFPELNFHLRWELYGNETGFLVFRKGRVRKKVITHCWTDPEDMEPFPFYMGYVTEDFDFKLEE